MESQSAWDTLIKASRYMFRGPSAGEILIFFWSKISRLKEVERAFFMRGKSLGLTEEEIRLL